MGMISTVTLNFDQKETKEEFLAWFLDGGGEYQFSEFCEMHKKVNPPIVSRTVEGSWNAMTFDSNYEDEE